MIPIKSSPDVQKAGRREPITWNLIGGNHHENRSCMRKW